MHNDIIFVVWLGIRSKGPNGSTFVVTLFRSDHKQGNNQEGPWATTHYSLCTIIFYDEKENELVTFDSAGLLLSIVHEYFLVIR